jgi:hypothetical protein
VVPGLPEEDEFVFTRAREPENVSAHAAACRQTITPTHLISDPIIDPSGSFDVIEANWKSLTHRPRLCDLMSWNGLA